MSVEGLYLGLQVGQSKRGGEGERERCRGGGGGGGGGGEINLLFYA